MTILAMAAAAAWRASCEPARRRLAAGLSRPDAAQQAVLARLLAANHATVFGRDHRLRPSLSVQEFQHAVPVREYEDLCPWIERVKAGEAGVLTASPVEAFERSSGSTANAKYIPYTSSFRSELAEAVRAWMGDLFRRHPGAMAGPSWWITSPLRVPREVTEGGVPVGLGGDEEYLGWWEKKLAPSLWAVPPAVRTAGDWDETMAWTLRLLLQSSGLRLISVWNPSLMEILWQKFCGAPDQWLDQLARGSGPSLHRGLGRCLRARPRLAARLGRHLADGSLTPAAVWPRLAVVSAWAAAEAAPAAAAVRRLFAQATFQPKGLLATEGVITVPWQDDEAPPVPALHSHFLEFEESRGGPVRRVHELEQGREYGVVLTTGGGLWRYRLGDQVRVEGGVLESPRLHFVGRTDGVCDLRGEKLNPVMVGRVLDSCQDPDAFCRFAMLAPDRRSDPPGYLLLLGDGADPRRGARMGWRVEVGLAANPHYAHCRAAGQLAPLRVFVIRGAAQEAFMKRCVALGQIAGTVKTAALNRHEGWDQWFDGLMLEVES